MWNDWIRWLSSLRPEELAWLLLPFALFDATRYSGAVVGMCLWDLLASLSTAGRRPKETDHVHVPSVCVIIAGLNEAGTIESTLGSVWGTYPHLEIIVVDDGSSDDMARVASNFADGHGGVRVLTRPCRGGKSSALNFALALTAAEIIVGVDADSHLAPNAIWEIVQPFRDANVGAVSGTVLARNAFVNLVTWLQALEYLTCIFVGRMVEARLRVLGIVSGAFGAFRRSALQRVGGWDVGPGEDGDLTVKLRKLGCHIASAPHAQCFTNLPTSWRRLVRQRRRWDWAVVRCECRKHLGLGNLLSPNFRFSNLMFMLDRWTYNLLFPCLVLAYLVWSLVLQYHEHTWKQYLLYYLIYVGCELVQAGGVLYYSLHLRRDLPVLLAFPLMPPYRLLLLLVRVLSVVEETLWRQSFRDGFVPRHVREVARRW